MKNKIKFLSVFGSLAIFLSFTFNPLNDKKIIVIDAGHGGQDFGAQIGGELEKKIVESIAKKINSLNEKSEIEIVLLREGDRFIKISERVSEINKINPNLLISLHVNISKNTKKNGVNAYVSRQNDFYDQSKQSAENLVEKISNKNLAKGEVKDASFSVIKNSKCPALLLEVGYLSNQNDKTYITSENGQNEIAGQILEFIKK